MTARARNLWWMFLSCVVCTGCTKAPPAGPAVLRLSQRNEPADLDPARVTLPDEFFIIRALSEGLLTPNPDGGAPLPAAAERFESSADGLVYTFHLREARWSSGEPVTAADFVASYRRLLTPATAAPKAQLFFPVKNARAFATGAAVDFSAVGFAAPDTRTLVVTLASPTPRFPYYVASGPWIPMNPRTVEKSGRAATQPGNYAGNGPFTLAEWRPHQRIVVKRNSAYRDASSVRLDEVHFVHFDNGDAEERAYRAGQIDVTMDVPRTKLETYTRERPAELHRVALAETRFLTFNTRRPALADARVRRALALTIDRDRLTTRVLLGGQEPATRFVPTGLREASGTFSGGVGSDPDEARRLLADAGFPGGKNFPRLELSAWSTSQTSTLETVQAMWKQELGIEVGLAVRDAKVHFSALTSGDYDIAFMTAIPDVADAVDLLDRFATNAPQNFPHWASPDFDRHLAAGELATAEQLLLEAAVVAPLYFNVHAWLQSPRVHGWREDALWTRYYSGVSLTP